MALHFRGQPTLRGAKQLCILTPMFLLRTTQWQLLEATRAAAEVPRAQAGSKRTAEAKEVLNVT